ncbi:hypothetical protein AB0J71_49505 [Nonomuraea sp. NPDC049637]|uniref:hypothetical protein n=1 Tax=Nonomuraea sp. NPDC049637 TaxID=3154356 RepID=UPI003417DC1A
MSTRRLTAAALVAGGLALGAVTGSAMPASAVSASTVSASTVSASAVSGSWHLAGYYQYRDQCVRAGFSAVTSGGIVQDFRCEVSGSRFALSLFY